MNMKNKKELTKRTTLHMTDTHIHYLKVNGISYGKLMSAMVDYLIINDATEFNDDEYRDAWLLYEVRQEISAMNFAKINTKINQFVSLMDELEEQIEDTTKSQ